jgi:hypothetical protein
MANARKKVIPKKPGRKPTGKDPVMSLRMPPGLRREIEDWAKRQDDKPTLSKAVISLVRHGLLGTTNR